MRGKHQVDSKLLARLNSAELVADFEGGEGVAGLDGEVEVEVPIVFDHNASFLDFVDENVPEVDFALLAFLEGGGTASQVD